MFSRFFLNLLFPILSIAGWWFAWRAIGQHRTIVLCWAAFVPVALWTLLGLVDVMLLAVERRSWLGFARQPAGLTALLAVCVFLAAHRPEQEIFASVGIAYICSWLANPWDAAGARLELLVPVWLAAYAIAAHFLFPAGLLPEHLLAMLR
jgi:hypothetical protein